jgi:hypothetical protein
MRTNRKALQSIQRAIMRRCAFESIARQILSDYKPNAQRLQRDHVAIVQLLRGDFAAIAMRLRSIANRLQSDDKRREPLESKRKAV